MTSFEASPNYFVDFREERKLFIRGKYIDRKYVIKSCGGDTRALSAELNEAIRQCNLLNLLQVFAEEVSLTSPLPGHVSCSLTHSSVRNYFCIDRLIKKQLYTSLLLWQPVKDLCLYYL